MNKHIKYAIVIILLIPTAIFFVRSIVSLGVFFKWNKKERLTGTVGKQLDVKTMNKLRRYVYEFTIERGEETVLTELQEVRSNGRDPTVKQGAKIEVYYDPQNGRYRERKATVRELWLHPLLFVLFAAAAYGVYTVASVSASRIL